MNFKAKETTFYCFEWRRDSTDHGGALKNMEISELEGNDVFSDDIMQLKDPPELLFHRYSGHTQKQWQWIGANFE